MFAPCLSATFLDRLASVPAMYWVLWLGSLALSISLVVLLRTRWGQSRPLQKCAVLSLLVHALLACLAMTVRVVVGEGGGGMAGAPIRVRIVQDSDDPIVMANIRPDAAEETAPPIYESPQPASEATATVEGTDAREAEAVEAPDLIELPEASEQTADELEPVDDQVADVADIAVDNITTANGADAGAIEEELPAVQTAPVDAANLPRSDVPNIAISHPAENRTSGSVATSVVANSADPATGSPSSSARYSLRNSPGRLGLVELQGGSSQTEAAVAAALTWLAKAQSDDGRWDSNRHGAGQEHAVLGHNRGGAGRQADTGISALALLAFLGAGHSHQQGDYQDTVRRGLEFLLRSQAGDGNLFGEATLYAQMYCHSMSTFAMAEAMAMTHDERLRPAVASAVDFSLRAQHSATGGWRYRPTIDTGDTSQLGWQMMALASAERAGVDVPTHTWLRVGRFLRSVRRGQYGGLASYRPDGPPSTSMTAEAFYCRDLLQEISGEQFDEQAAAEATRNLLASLPDHERINLYYWYYASLALHGRQQSGEQANAAWHQWNDALCEALVRTQQTAGTETGSWNTNTLWGGYGGRVYTTAMAAMCLEVYYRYAPTPRSTWSASRPTAQQISR
jgi:hypothetical protein